jgi:manganese/zinc/iron transport system substrate-binding protein
VRPFLIVLGSLLVLSCISCRAGDKGGAGSEKLQIVTTTGMVADLARVIGGDYVEVEALMGAGVDPHLYKASPGDINKLSSADAVLYSGLHLEGKMADVLEQVGRRIPVLAVTESVPKDKLLTDQINPQYPDPHIWFDMSLWAETIQPVADFLKKELPEHADEIQANADEYKATMAALHEETLSEMKKVPEARRVLITAHDAFRYFGRAYGIEVLGIQGISTESEAGLKEINNLVDVIVKRGVKAVFVETSVSQKNIQALIEGAKQRGADVKIGGSLFSDAMGAEGTSEGTYPGMIRHNVSQIVGGLQ